MEDRITFRVKNFQKLLRELQDTKAKGDSKGVIKGELDDLCLYILDFQSPHWEVLLPEDQGIEENNRFQYYL